MGHDYELHAAPPESAVLLAQVFGPKLCEEDAREIRSLGVEPEDAIRRSIAGSEFAWALALGGEPAALVGVVAHEHWGQFWLLTTPAVRTHPKGLLRMGHDLIPPLGRRYGILENIVDSRHEQALRLAKHFGFLVEETGWKAPDSTPFVRIRYEHREPAEDAGGEEG